MLAECWMLDAIKAYTAGQKDAQMLRDICGWLNINSMRAEKVGWVTKKEQRACFTMHA